MCYKDQKQKRNEERLNQKIQETNFPVQLRKYFTVKIESKDAALKYFGVIVDLLKWFIKEGIIEKDDISEIKVYDLSNVMAEDITLYLKQRESDGISPTTLETRKQMIRSFWNYLARIKGCDIPENFFKDVTYKGISSGNNLTRKFPSENQIKNMEEKILKKHDTHIRNRNIAIFNVLKGTGVREAELAGLDLSSLHLDGEIPYIKVMGKRVYREQEARTVYLSGTALRALTEWLDYRKTIPEIVDQNAVFINKTGKRTTENDIIQLFKNYGDGMTAHMMRHWYASVLNSKGNVAFAQQQLGHKSINTTINNYANGAVGMKEILMQM